MHLYFMFTDNFTVALYCTAIKLVFRIYTCFKVDLLYRRAAGDRNGKIYCLANADMLDYDVSEKTESYLEKYIKGNEG